MAKVILPGKKTLEIEGNQKLRDLRMQGIVPKEYSLVRKDPSTGAVRQIRDDEDVAGDDLVFGIPKHVQGGYGA